MIDFHAHYCRRTTGRKAASCTTRVHVRPAEEEAQHALSRRAFRVTSLFVRRLFEHCAGRCPVPARHAGAAAAPCTRRRTERLLLSGGRCHHWYWLRTLLTLPGIMGRGRQESSLDRRKLGMSGDARQESVSSFRQSKILRPMSSEADRTRRILQETREADQKAAQRLRVRQQRARTGGDLGDVSLSGGSRRGPRYTCVRLLVCNACPAPRCAPHAAQ